jgi:queuosine precursor transporter
MREDHMRLDRLRTAVLYVGTVVVLNVGFSLSPQLDWFWSLLVGGVLVLRDFAQRAWGHWCLALMAAAAVLSYVLGSPAVAVASATAFAVSETADWAVYTVTQRPFADRVLLSTGISAPIDSAVFLFMAGLFGPRLFAISVASKLAAGLALWALLRGRARSGANGAASALDHGRRAGGPLTKRQGDSR